MYLLYARRDNRWEFWHNDFGWGDLTDATLFHDPSGYVLEGEYLFVGRSGEDRHLATLTLDLAASIDKYVREKDSAEWISGSGTILNKYAQLALAGQLASELQASELEASVAGEIFEYGYALYLGEDGLDWD